MLRVFDVLFSILGLIISMPVLLLLLILCYLDTGSPIFRQVRIGQHQKPFTLVKFRTMKRNTASVATHLMDTSAITPFGSFLRRTKLDELPQLWNVVSGEMSLVGPRPCLPNQLELIEKRIESGVFDARPGITGLAQIKGIDMSAPVLLAKIDAQMLSNLSIAVYFKYIILTMIGHGAGDRIKISKGDGE